MSWVAVAVGSGALGAATKYMDAKQQQKQEQAKLMANAAQIQYSPWTHANAQIMGASAGSPTAAALGGALQGGLAGVAMGQANGGFGGGSAASPGMNGALDTSATQSTLGGAGYSNQLGQQANNFQGSQFGQKYQTLYPKG